MHSRAPPRFSSFSPYRFPFPLEFLSQLCTNLHAPWTSLALVLLARSLGALSVELPPRVSPPRPGDTDSSRREERGELFSFKSTWPFPPHLSALILSRFPLPPSPFSRPRRFVRAFAVIISTCLLYSQTDHVPDTQILVAWLPSRSLSFNRRRGEEHARVVCATFI